MWLKVHRQTHPRQTLPATNPPQDKPTPRQTHPSDKRTPATNPPHDKPSPVTNPPLRHLLRKPTPFFFFFSLPLSLSTKEYHILGISRKWMDNQFCITKFKFYMTIYIILSLPTPFFFLSLPPPYSWNILRIWKELQECLTKLMFISIHIRIYIETYKRSEHPLRLHIYTPQNAVE